MHLTRNAQPLQAALKYAVRVRVISRTTPAGQVTVPRGLVHDEVRHGETALDHRRQRPRLNDSPESSASTAASGYHCRMPSPRAPRPTRPCRTPSPALARAARRSAPVPAPCRWVGGHVLEQSHADGGVAAVGAGGLGQFGGSDQAGVGFDDDMGLEPVLTPVTGLVRVPGVRVDRGDHPVRGRPSGRSATARRSRPSPRPARRPARPPAPATPPPAPPRSYACSPSRPCAGQDLARRQLLQQRQSVVDQRRHQLLAGLARRPRQCPASRHGRSRSRCTPTRSARRAGHNPPDPAHRGDQLGHGVLPGHRVIEHRGVQRPPGLAPHHPGRDDHLTDRVEDPVRRASRRPAGAAKTSTSSDGTPASLTANPTAAFHRRSNVTASAACRSDSPCKRLQHQHRRDHAPAAHSAAPAPTGTDPRTSTRGNNRERCSARNANTLPAGSRCPATDSTSSSSRCESDAPCTNPA